MFNLKFKKMKVLKYLSLAALSMCFASCSEDNSVTLKVETELGGLSEFVTVKDQEVVIKMTDEKEDGVDCKVITSSLALEVSKSVASNYSYSLEVEVLDENHTKIASLPYYYIEDTYDSDNDDYEHILNAGTIRAQMKRSAKVSEMTPDDQEEWKKIVKEGAYILIKPSSSYAKFVEYKAKSSNTEADASSNDTTTVDGDLADTSSEDWDAMLDSYEECVDKYIALLKKASAGDMTALTEYPALLSKAQEFGDKMESAKGSMSASQVARYTKITAKMLKVAQE